MKQTWRRGLSASAFASVLISGMAWKTLAADATPGWWKESPGTEFPLELRYPNAHGQIGVVSRMPVETKGHPFFEPMGTNGRACITCHQPANSMSLSVDTVQRRWKDAGSKDPLFAMVDGANCPNLNPDDERSHSRTVAEAWVVPRRHALAAERRERSAHETGIHDRSGAGPGGLQHRSAVRTQE